MCILEAGRALQRLEGFGGHPVLGKPLSQYYGVQLELGESKNRGKGSACRAGSLVITPLKLAQGEIRCIGFQEIQLAGGFGRNMNRENLGDASRRKMT